MKSSTRSTWRWTLPAVALTALLGMGSAHAEDQPKAAPAPANAATAPAKTWTLDANNWQLGKDLLPDVVLNRVKSGEYYYKVVEVDPDKFKQNYSKAFWSASEANAGKYDVDTATCGLKDVKTGKMPDFYFGYPFPKIDPKDPMAACKMAWNFTAANQMGNGQGATFTLNGIDSTGEFKRIKTWLHVNAFIGRSAGPIPNPENLRAVSMSGVLEPQDVDGAGRRIEGAVFNLALPIHDPPDYRNSTHQVVLPIGPHHFRQPAHRPQHVLKGHRVCDLEPVPVHHRAAVDQVQCLAIRQRVVGGQQQRAARNLASPLTVGLHAVPRKRGSQLHRGVPERAGTAGG